MLGSYLRHIWYLHKLQYQYTGSLRGAGVSWLRAVPGAWTACIDAAKGVERQKEFAELYKRWARPSLYRASVERRDGERGARLVRQITI